MFMFTHLNQDSFPLPNEIASSYKAHHGKHLTLLSHHSIMTNDKLEQKGKPFFICKGWKKFIEHTGLRIGQSICFKITSPSTLNVLLFDKDGGRKYPIIALSKKQISSKAIRIPFLH